MSEKFWKAYPDKAPFNSFQDAPQTPEQVESVRQMMKQLITMSTKSPPITSMAQTLVFYFYFECINMCDNYLEYHDPGYRSVWSAS